MDDYDPDSGPPPRRRRPARAKPQPPTIELRVPFGPGAVVRVRYRPLGPDRREGGGALNIWSGDDMVAHVNPRPHRAHQTLVLNSHLGGGWGGEERPGGYPVFANEVTLTVRVGPDGFDIEATPDAGEPFHYCYAYHHGPCQPLDRITIDLPDVASVEVRAEG